jgi:hypothetical protein
MQIQQQKENDYGKRSTTQKQRSKETEKETNSGYLRRPPPELFTPTCYQSVGVEL